VTTDRTLEADRRVVDLVEGTGFTGRRLDDGCQELPFSAARTANTFSDRPVSDDQLREAYELMKWGPTWANTVPLRVVYIRSEPGKARLFAHLQPGNVDKARSAPVNAVLAVDGAYHEQIPRLLPFRPEMRDTLEADPDLRQRIKVAGGWMQAAYFILAIRSVGLAAGPMGGFDAVGLDADLFRDSAWRSLLVVNIGYPGDKPWMERLPRLDYDEAVRHL
jgi:3-hydroxypropanoate dehydrogenase